jgi:gluconolactonase
VLEADGTGRLLAELDPPTFPNGIAIEADGSVVWAESYTGMVRRLRLATGAIEDIARLPGNKPIADGMAVGAEGLLYVTTVNGGGIDVIRPDGALDRHITAGTIPTNCVFLGSDLIMTDAGVLATGAAASYGGQLWRLPIDVEGLPTWHGHIG